MRHEFNTDSMMYKLIKPGAIFLILALTLWQCKDPWEDHIKVSDGVTSSMLLETIQDMPELSIFTGLLLEAGWEEELTSSKSFTVWVPTNEAMEAVDLGELADSASLALFVNNHISFGAYSYHTLVSQETVKRYSGKNILLDYENNMAGEANLLEPLDQLAKNGILHVIDRALVPKPNVWDIVESTELAPKHVEFLNSLSGLVFDPSVATLIGVDPLTGKPVYDTISGMVWSNLLITEVRDLQNEDTLSTIILVEDAVFDSEYAKYRNYFKTADSVESDDLTRWMICRDLVFPGYQLLEDIPDNLLSLYGIKIPFDHSAVQHTYEASNGIVYVMSSADVRLEDKIPPVIVQGEDSLKVVFTSISGQTGYTRQADLASEGYDFILDNHGASPGDIKYHMGEFVAGYYNFYWVAVNDFNGSYRSPDPEIILEQRLEFVKLLGIEPGNTLIWSNPSPISDFTVVIDSTYENAQEIYLGQRFFTSYQDVWLQVTGSGRNTTICLDYLKAVPVLE